MNDRQWPRQSGRSYNDTPRRSRMIGQLCNVEPKKNYRMPNNHKIDEKLGYKNKVPWTNKERESNRERYRRDENIERSDHYDRHRKVRDHSPGTRTNRYERRYYEERRTKRSNSRDSYNYYKASNRRDMKERRNFYDKPDREYRRDYKRFHKEKHSSFNDTKRKKFRSSSSSLRTDSSDISSSVKNSTNKHDKNKGACRSSLCEPNSITNDSSFRGDHKSSDEVSTQTSIKNHNSVITEPFLVSDRSSNNTNKPVEEDSNSLNSKPTIIHYKVKVENVQPSDTKANNSDFDDTNAEGDDHSVIEITHVNWKLKPIELNEIMRFAKYTGNPADPRQTAFY